MNNDSQRPKVLSTEAQAQIYSSVHVSSLNDVLFELVKNSLDANAGNIDIHFDFAKGYCSVLDDGQGILADEFLENGGLAQLYYTSRAEQSSLCHGKYGRFLYSLSGVSLLSITSCQTPTGTVNSAVFRDGKRLSASTGTADESLGVGRTGTKVVVHDLFRNMPVRVKYRLNKLENRPELNKEFRALKKSLVALVLTTPRSIAIDVRSTTHRYTHRPIMRLDRKRSAIPPFDLDCIASTFFQAGLVDTPASADWKQASTQTTLLSIKAAFSLRPAPSRDAQFISLNQYPLTVEHYKPLFDQINDLFDSASFGSALPHRSADSGEIESGNQQRNLRQRPLVRQSIGGGKRVDRWPVFYVRVALHSDPDPEMKLDGDINRTVISIAEALRLLVIEFLQSTGFQISSHAKREVRKKSKQPPLVVPTGTTLQSSSFSAWSRVKSAKGTPKDLLAGLPFMLRKEPRTGLVSDTDNRTLVLPKIDLERPPDSAEIEWTNPRTNNMLRIDARTGTALPQNEGLSPSLLSDIAGQSTRESTCTVASKLIGKTPLNARVEEAMKSITPDYYASSTKKQRPPEPGSVCTLESGTPLFVSGPTSIVDPVCASITKEMLRAANVLGQVDGKFVLVSIRPADVSGVDTDAMLVLIDQHAADERVKVENLFQQLCDKNSVMLAQPIAFEVNGEERQRFEHSQEFFASWKIKYRVVSVNDAHQIQVVELPSLIAERCRLKPRLVVELLRREVWQDHRASTVRYTARVDEWLPQIGDCPPALLEMLTSRACRSAIMFNDVLADEQCKQLVSQLCDCLFPFQCGHGRPSLTSIARIRDVGVTEKMGVKDSTFGQAWKAWMSA